jgi:hypothetical protein
MFWTFEIPFKTGFTVLTQHLLEELRKKEGKMSRQLVSM